MGESDETDVEQQVSTNNSSEEEKIDFGLINHPPYVKLHDDDKRKTIISYNIKSHHDESYKRLRYSENENDYVFKVPFKRNITDKVEEREHDHDQDMPRRSSLNVKINLDALENPPIDIKRKLSINEEDLSHKIEVGDVNKRIRKDDEA